MTLAARARNGLVAAMSAVMLLAGSTASAQMTGAPSAGYKREPGAASTSVPAPLREIGFDQHLDERLPLDTTFVDESGAAVRLGSYVGARPVILVFAYYDCPMLCTMVTNGLASTLGVLSLKPGTDFDVIVVSFDPRDKPAAAAAKKAAFLERYKHQGAAGAAHFLTGDQASISRLTKAAGFRYTWDDKTQQFAHPTGIIVLTPDGRPARYLFGIDYGPRDLRLALVEASEGKVGAPVDALLLYCYHYDPLTGRYGVAIMRTMRLGGGATVLLIGGFVFVMLRREKRSRRDARGRP